MDRFQDFIGVDLWTAVFVLLNTLAVFFVAKKFLFVPVMNMIQRRQAEIDGMYADANAAREQALQMEADCRAQLENAAQTGEQLVKEAVARGQSREEEILRQANAEAAAILNKATADIAQEKKKAINDAKDEISEMAMAIAGKVVGRVLTETDQTDLVDAFIAELGEEV